MTLHEARLSEVIAELAPLVGGRIQRIDVVAEREIVIEIRCPGRSVRVLLSARAGLGRVCAVPERPPRTAPGGGFQATLRTRLGGRPLTGLRAMGRTVELDAADERLTVKLTGGRDAFRIVRIPPASPEHHGIPAQGRHAGTSLGAGLIGAPSLDEDPTASAEVNVSFAELTFPISEAIRIEYEARAPRMEGQGVADRVLAALTARKKKMKRLRDNVRRDRAKLESMMERGKVAELLKPMLGRIPRGAQSVMAMDWALGHEVEIALDPALGATENMERMFRGVKKATRGLPQVDARLEKIERALAELEAKVVTVRSADLEGLADIARAEPGDVVHNLALEASVAAGSQTSEGKSPLDRWSKRFVATDGTEIRVGRGAKENDRLTFGGAKGDDYWLHARGTSGAHVVLKNEKGQVPSAEALTDAALLAAYHSSARNDGKVEVVYTEARHVKKTKGAPPGRVGVARGKTMLVVMDEARLAKLLGR